MLFKYVAATALFLITALSSPFSISIDIKDDSVTDHPHHNLPFLQHLAVLNLESSRNVTKAIEVSTKYSDYGYGLIKGVKKGKNLSMLKAIGGVFQQYQTFSAAYEDLPKSLSEKEATEAVDAWYYLCKSLEAEFGEVVDSAKMLKSFDVLTQFLHDMIKSMDIVFDFYNNRLFDLLPAEDLKETFTDYSAPASGAINIAIDALQSHVRPPIEGKLLNNKQQIEL